MRILVIEDDPTLNKNIQQALNAEGYVTQTLYDGALAERLLKKETFDCVVIDINLPGKNGFEVSKIFRTYNKHTPLIMLTAFSDIDDKLKGFESGADDYLTKPFFMSELLIRIQSLIKRSQQNPTNTGAENIVIDDIIIDLAHKKVVRSGLEINLTPREYNILLKLAAHPGEIISKNNLVKEIWGNSIGFNTNTIEVYINFLRKKIDKPFDKQIIKTKIGFGYYLDTK